ncbi:MAG: helix-turn-helix domain-containing protein [Planctomycetota bacterium]
MARRRALPPLVETLAQAAAPAYLVDARRVIVFANAALAEWLELPADAVQGRAVEYHAAASNATTTPPGGSGEGSGLLPGLCPSPVALAGGRSRGVVSAVGLNGRLRQRAAEFLPLPPPPPKPEAVAEAEAGQPPACPVLVLCDAADQPGGKTNGSTTPADLVDGDDSYAELHSQLQRFRARQRSAGAWPFLLGESPAVERLRRQLDAVVRSGASALFVGGEAGDRLAAARHAFNERTTQAEGSGSSPQLVITDAALLDAQQIAERIDRLAQTSDDATPTLLLASVEQLPLSSQRGLAAQLRSAPHICVYATGSRPVADDTLAAEIGTVVVGVPELKERKADLPILAQAIIERTNAGSGKQLAGLTPEAGDMLALYPWPGGFTELGALVEAACRSAAGPLISPADLPVVLRQAAVAAEAPRSPPTRIVLDAYLGKIERELVTRALAGARGNKAEAARVLGMTRPRLYRRLVNLGLLDPAKPPGEPETPAEPEEPDAPNSDSDRD